MKFAFISTMEGWGWGGSEELWSQAAARLRREGHDVQASSCMSPARSEKLAALQKLGIDIESRPSRPVKWYRKAARRIAGKGLRGFERLIRFKPDLAVISQGFNGGGFEWAKVCIANQIPYVVIVQCNSESWWFIDSVMNDAVVSYTNARRVFCVSQGNLDLLRLQVAHSLPNAEVAWNPFGVSPDLAVSWPEGDVFRMASVARLDPAAKGHDLLLQAIAGPEWRDRPLEVNLFGAGSYDLNVRKMAEMLQLRSVKFCGHVSNIEALWKENHLLVMPSRYEGLPLALVEAMWCGRPAVVTDVGGNAELCLDGETGFVAAAPTVPLVRDALERAWQRRHDWQKMGRAARARAEALIPRDPIAVFSETLKCYAEPTYQAEVLGEAIYAKSEIVSK